MVNLKSSIHSHRSIFGVGSLALLGLAFGAVACGVDSTSRNTGGLGGEEGEGSGGRDGSGGATSSGGAGTGEGGEGGLGEAGSAGTGGNESEASGGDDGSGGSETVLECPKGVTIVMSDYLSTQIALSSLEGETLSESFISTASTETDGLAFALSGDVALPSAAPASGNVVLLDRFGTNVVTWVNPSSGEVIGQLPVGTGFESNPADYLEIDENTAWVTRSGQNENPGSESNDQGGDVLVIDLVKKEIKGSIIMPVKQDLPARPSSLSEIGDEVFVSLNRYSLDYSETGEAMIVSLDPKTGEENFNQTLKGHKACGALTASPDGSVLAMACTGVVDYYGAVEDLSQSAVLLFDASKRPLKVIETIAAADIVNLPLQNAITFVNNETILLNTQTASGGAENNELLSLNLISKKIAHLLEASPDEEDNGKGLVYHAPFCAPGCSDVCLMPDSDQGLLQVLDISNPAKVTLLAPIRVEDNVGLPPVGITGR